MAVFFSLSPQFSSTTQANSPWQQTFASQRVSLVSVNPDNPNQIAAEVDNRLKMTWDGGLLWRDTTGLAAVANAVAFDPVYPGNLYAATQRGIYHSADNGLSWQLFGPVQSQTAVSLSVAVDRDYVFTDQYTGAGSADRLNRFDRQGNLTDTNFPQNDAGPLYLDQLNQRLYVGTRGNLYRTSDNGSSWQTAGLYPNVGFGTLRVVARDQAIWQLSTDGLYKSVDGGASWTKLVSRSNLREMYYDDRQFAGLVINNGNAFFGASSYQGQTKDAVEKLAAGDELDRLGLNQLVLDAAGGGQRLWVATDNGLWGGSGLVTSEAQVKRPVIIIPGILGSWQVHGVWLLDPIQNTYAPLLTQLVASGFVKDKTLFTFPYQWRQDNNVTARQLADKIAEVRQVCRCAKVDLVGHSMGGLVARAYVESDYYHDDVENLIELGTPNAGSVEAYSIWEAGVSGAPRWEDRFKMQLFNIEAYEHGYTNITAYVRNALPTVGQLLPVYSYIDGRNYPDGYPRNQFLEQLNANKDKLNRVKLSLMGSNARQTLSQLQLSAPQPSNFNWPDGQITQKSYGPGDDTVPFVSLTSIGSPGLVLDSSHRDLPNFAGDYVVAQLIGQATQFSSKYELTHKYLMFYVKSPVRLSVTDPSGNVVNDDKNEVAGAFFTGSDEQVQFITIPEPSSGEYSIQLTGKGRGNYTAGAALLDDSDQDKPPVEVTGETTDGFKTSLTFDLDSISLNKVTSDPADPSAPDSSGHQAGQPDQPQSLNDSGLFAYSLQFLDESVGATGDTITRLSQQSPSEVVLPRAGSANDKADAFGLIALISAMLALALWRLEKILDK